MTSAQVVEISVTNNTEFFSELPSPRRINRSNYMYWYCWVQTIYYLLIFCTSQLLHCTSALNMTYYCVLYSRIFFCPLWRKTLTKTTKLYYMNLHKPANCVYPVNPFDVNEICCSYFKTSHFLYSSTSIIQLTYRIKLIICFRIIYSPTCLVFRRLKYINEKKNEALDPIGS